MSVDDIKDLQFDEIVGVKQIKGFRQGKVKGIDIWSLSVRVQLNENECIWYPPRMIKRLTDEK